MTETYSGLPSMRELVVFEAAYRQRSFTRAGMELQYSQASVSRRVASLERTLGVELFDRRRSEVAPTEAADVLAAAVATNLGELAAVTAGIRRRAATRTRLVLRADVSFTALVINPVLREFRERHPELDICVLSSFEPIERELQDFDLGIQYARNRSSNLMVEAIADEEVFPVCSPEFAAGLPATVSADVLAEQPLLHVDYDEPAWIEWRGFLATAGASVQTSLDGPVFTSYLACLDLAERGEGVALGWGATVAPGLAAGTLVRLPGCSLSLPDAICAYRRDTTSWEPVEELLDLVRAAIGPDATR